MPLVHIPSNPLSTPPGPSTLPDSSTHTPVSLTPSPLFSPTSVLQEILHIYPGSSILKNQKHNTLIRWTL